MRCLRELAGRRKPIQVAFAAILQLSTLRCECRRVMNPDLAAMPIQNIPADATPASRADDGSVDSCR